MSVNISSSLILSASLCVTMVLASGCDTHRFYVLKVRPYGEEQPPSEQFRSQKNRAMARELVARVAKRHGMEPDTDDIQCHWRWCETYRESATGIRLLVFEALAGDLHIELQQFGPVFETRRFGSIKESLLVESKRIFGEEAIKR